MSDGRDDVVAVRYSLAAIDGNNATVGVWQRPPA